MKYPLVPVNLTFLYIFPLKSLNLVLIPPQKNRMATGALGQGVFTMFLLNFLFIKGDWSALTHLFFNGACLSRVIFTDSFSILNGILNGIWNALWLLHCFTNSTDLSSTCRFNVFFIFCEAKCVFPKNRARLWGFAALTCLIGIGINGINWKNQKQLELRKQLEFWFFVCISTFFCIFLLLLKVRKSCFQMSSDIRYWKISMHIVKLVYIVASDVEVALENAKWAMLQWLKY